MKIKKRDNLVLGSLGLLFGSLLLLCGFLVYKVYIKNDTSNAAIGMARTNLSPTMTPWEVYENSEFGFSLEVPRLLLKEEAREKANYKYIAIFGENQYSNARGVAIGVTDRSLEEEIEEVKGQYGKDENAKLEKEIETEIAGEKGIKLSYKPKDGSSGLESKDVVVFNRGSYTYTLSTDPSQMEHIIKSFRWL